MLVPNSLISNWLNGLFGRRAPVPVEDILELTVLAPPGATAVLHAEEPVLIPSVFIGLKPDHHPLCPCTDCDNPLPKIEKGTTPKKRRTPRPTAKAKKKKTSKRLVRKAQPVKRSPKPKRTAGK